MTDDERKARDTKVRSETVQSLLRANHFAQVSRNQVVSNLIDSSKTNDKPEYLSHLDSSQRENLDKLAEIMPDERARPSLLEPACGPLLSLMVSICDTLGRKGDRDVMMSAIEKGL